MFRRVLADRFQESESFALRLYWADRIFMRRDYHQRFVHQRCQEGQNVRGFQAGARGYLLDGVEAPTSSEDSESPQQHLLCIGQPVITPVEHGAQRLLPGRRGSCSSSQQVQLVSETQTELGEAQYLDVDRSQFDCQWDPVKLAA
jgi:hypothetical protein